MRSGRHRGFTLVEVIITITILGIVAAVVMVFIRAPVQGYVDQARRAALTDVADGAVRRMARDLRQALPNSVRIINGNALEFMPVRLIGRYRVAFGTDGTTGSGQPLDFIGLTAPLDGAFDILGAPIQFQSTDEIVIYNLGPDVIDDTGHAVADAFADAPNNRRRYNGVTGTPLSTASTVVTTRPFPFDSPTHRFHVVDTPVTYSCKDGALRRYWGYPIAARQSDPPAGAMTALLADQNIGCAFTYAPGITARLGLVSIQLSITRDGEAVSIYQEIHVSNTP